jgi:hypothetical protein
MSNLSKAVKKHFAMLAKPQNFVSYFAMQYLRLKKSVTLDIDSLATWATSISSLKNEAEDVIRHLSAEGLCNLDNGISYIKIQNTFSTMEKAEWDVYFEDTIGNQFCKEISSGKGQFCNYTISVVSGQLNKYDKTCTLVLAVLVEPLTKTNINSEKCFYLADALLEAREILVNQAKQLPFIKKAK